MNIEKTGLDHNRCLIWQNAKEKEIVHAPSRNGWDVFRGFVSRGMHLVGRATKSGFVIFAFFSAMSLQLPAFATGIVALVWNPSSDPTVAGYKIYYGGASETYTNEIDVGNTTNATITGLIGQTTYYFAATTYNAEGVESPFSTEVPYLVPIQAVLHMQIVKSNGVPVSLSITANGVVPTQWTLQSSPDLRTWTALVQGTNLIVNILVPVNGLPAQFFRLVGQ